MDPPIAEGAKEVRLPGMLKLVIPGLLAKALLAMLVTPRGMEIPSREGSFAKALSPIEVTPLPMEMFVKLVQLLKEEAPRLTTLLGIVTFASPVWTKALLAMLVTVFGMIILVSA